MLLYLEIDSILKQATNNALSNKQEFSRIKKLTS